MHPEPARRGGKPIRRRAWAEPFDDDSPVWRDGRTAGPPWPGSVPVVAARGRQIDESKGLNPGIGGTGNQGANAPRVADRLPPLST